MKPLRINTGSQPEKVIQGTDAAYMKVDLTDLGKEIWLARVPAPQAYKYELPAISKSQSLSPLLALAEFADTTFQESPQPVQTSSYWLQEEHISSPDSSSLPSPWEIPNPFDDLHTPGAIPPSHSDDVFHLDTSAPRWLRVRVSMPRIVHRDLDVAGRAVSTKVHHPAPQVTPNVLEVPPKPPLPAVRRARSQQPLRNLEHQHENTCAELSSHSQAGFLPITKSVTTDYLNVFIPDHAIAF
ncbi:unnamed protein product [Peniophora sp. CBMAI 1063]|nr:unnamed protein product [Peniophora sp. CBMAI 1063]